MYFLSRFWKLLIPPLVKTGMELHQESPATAQVSRRKISPPGQVSNPDVETISTVSPSIQIDVINIWGVKETPEKATSLMSSAISFCCLSQAKDFIRQECSFLWKGVLYSALYPVLYTPCRLRTQDPIIQIASFPCGLACGTGLWDPTGTRHLTQSKIINTRLYP